MIDPTPRFQKVLDALSQLGNVCWPFWSHTDTTANESISGRCHREQRAFRRAIDAFFRLFGDYDHCRNSHYADLDRAYKTIEQDDRP
jgi:hypothetical protein